MTFDGAVAEVILTSDDGLNRFDEVLHTDLANFLPTLRTRTDIRAMVLTSEGKVFSAGGDFELIRRDHFDSQLRREGLDDGRRIIDGFLELPFPVVVGLKGEAVEVVRGRLSLPDAKVMDDGRLRFEVPVLAKSEGTAILRVDVMTYVCERTCQRVVLRGSQVLKVGG